MTDTRTPEPVLDARVRTVRTAADGVRELVLTAPAGGPLPAWSPGAHIDLLLGPGLVRQYSLCGDPEDRTRWRVAVLRQPLGRGGSALVHDRIRAGDLLRVRGPRNNFPLLPAAAYLFVAGGIGITALLPMVAAADAAGADWRLLYGGRSRRSMAYQEELARYGSCVDVCPQDETGLLDLDGALATAPFGALVYCCGPEPLLRAVEQRRAGPRLHVERFAPRPVEDAPGTAAFEVVLRRSGRTVHVAADESVLAAVQAAGAAVLDSCREGTCGTCETTVLAGRPDHRDSVLDEDERAAGATMMVCVSRSLTPVLELDL
ncbi:PDR/VanB family oxidoreductase [Pseudonocardia xinjiangensis]|uniref:PDR/VanB family oxidoreductase n=1 Tax=Pseudonocardia xinjiangensis TaxID=75289 RepID=UPI003D8E0C31